MKQTRTELKKQYNNQLQKIKHDHHIQPSIILEYLYMKQDNEEEALEMLEQEIQRTLLYSHTLSYHNYSETVTETINQILTELQDRG